MLVQSEKIGISRKLAGGQGFEPRIPGPEPGVIPFNYPPSGTRGGYEQAYQIVKRTAG